MTLDLSNALADVALAALYTTSLPATSNLRIRTGAVAGAENADSGTVLATIVLPATPWTGTGGTISKNGTWSDSDADATGTAAHFRLTGSTTTLLEEGTTTATGGGGDMTLDNVSIAIHQVVTIATYSRSA